MTVVASIRRHSVPKHERASAKDTIDSSRSITQVNDAKSCQIKVPPPGSDLLRRRSSSGLLENDCFRRARTMSTLDIAVSTTTPRASFDLKSSSACSSRLTQDSMSKSLVEYTWLLPDQNPWHIMLLSRSNHDDEDNNSAENAYNMIESLRQELLPLIRLEASRSKLRLPNDISSARSSA